MSETIFPGFADPVTDAQRCFRAVLDAMARPGHMATVSGVAPPAPFRAAFAAAVLTLVDHETPVWLDPSAQACADWIGFHTGAAFRPILEAEFALALALPDLATLNAGTHEAPETSATVILQVASLSAGRIYRLAGPGLREPAVLRVDGLPEDFVAQWRRNHTLFPRGIDLVLCAGDALTALPRTVQIEEV
jgi:alpha-D-ribose 1-methylphosphonate 5-triphosphate synthase subunit PhnH